MIIRAKKIHSIPSNSIRNIERIDKNFLLINIWIKQETFETVSRTLYGLYYFDDVPPLEMGFDSKTGLLKEVTIFVEPPKICRQKSMDNIPLWETDGQPAADLSFARKGQYYYDEICDIEIHCCSREFWFFLKNHALFRKIHINKDLSILLDSEDHFIGAVMQNLSQEEIDRLASE